MDTNTAEGKETEITHITPYETTLYEAGMKRGHLEMMRQIANRLHRVSGQYGEDVDDDVVERVKQSLEKMAKQLEVETASQNKEEQVLLKRALYLRKQERFRMLRIRIGGAVAGAFEGWKRGG